MYIYIYMYNEYICSRFGPPPPSPPHGHGFPFPPVDVGVVCAVPPPPHGHGFPFPPVDVGAAGIVWLPLPPCGCGSRLWM